MQLKNLIIVNHRFQQRINIKMQISAEMHLSSKEYFKKEEQLGSVGKEAVGPNQ